MAARKIIERTALVLLVMLGYALYFPISLRTIQLPAHDPVLWIDRATPLGIGWVYVYVFVYIMSLWPVFVVADVGLFRKVAAAYVATEIAAYSLFFAVPVHMKLRPETIPTASFSEWGLRLVYHLDLPGNCLPSLHVSMGLLAALACWRADRVVGGFAVLVAVLIGASTMFTKQHYFADVITGFALGATTYWLIVRPHDLDGVAESETRFHRGWTMVLFGIYAAGIGIFYVMYQADFRPWQG